MAFSLYVERVHNYVPFGKSWTLKLGHSEHPDVEVVGLAGAEVTGGAGIHPGLARKGDGN
jgi:hypothetical protein